MPDTRTARLGSAAILITLVWTGCQTSDGPTSSGPGGATREELARLVQSAITAKDMDAMMGLYHWEGAEEADRERQRSVVQGYFQGSVVDTDFLPLPPDFANEFVAGDTLSRTNLPLEGHLRVRYGEDRTGPRTSAAFPYSMAGDRYILPVLLRIPLDTSDPRNQQLSLVVFGEDADGRVPFEASCNFMAGDDEREERFTSPRGTTRVFWGREFTRCSVRKTSKGGWLSFRLLQGRNEILFESERIEGDTASTWVLEAESEE